MERLQRRFFISAPKVRQNVATERLEIRGALFVWCFDQARFR
jgi:hypothetical protein